MAMIGGQIPGLCVERHLPCHFGYASSGGKMVEHVSYPLYETLISGSSSSVLINPYLLEPLR
jgi:hypothetical protein